MKNQFWAKFMALCLMLGSHLMWAQNTIVTLTTTSDTYISSWVPTNTTLGTQAAMQASTWTHDNSGGNGNYFDRILMNFNFAAIPNCATVTSAVLTLNAVPEPGFILLAGNNNVTILSPMTANWQENSTWNSISGAGYNLSDPDRVIIPATITTSDVININATNLVNKMIQGAIVNRGFAITLQTEQTYRSLVIATRENPTVALRPVLTVTYQTMPTAAPTFALSPSTAVCAGTMVDYSLNPVPFATTYVWRRNGNVINTSTSPIYSRTWLATELGNQTITAFALTSCRTTASVRSVVNVAAVPVQPGVITGSTTGFCVGSIQRYSFPQGAAGTVYEWRLGADILTDFKGNIGYVNFPSIGSATISVVAKSSNGACSSNQSLKSVTVSGVPTGVVITGPTTVCPDYSYNYAVSPVNQSIGYHWKVIKTNDTDPTPTTYGKNYNNGMNVKYPYAPGLNYTLSIAATNKCGSIDVTLPVSVRNNTAPKPYITCTNRVGTTCTQLSTPTNANVTSIVWNIDGVNVAALNNSATVDLNNPAYRGVNYKVTLSDGNCSYWAHFGECKNVVQGQTREAAEEIELPVAKPYLIYPNPTSGTVTIETKGQEGKAYVFNTFGQVVAEVELSKGETVYSVALAAKGLYTIKIKADGESSAYKLIVE